ncbi:MAG: SH3 domain-containing protein [Bacteriovorax sp.]|nr:SH3 domain-containing protein [Bacteriovorax sp.]
MQTIEKIIELSQSYLASDEALQSIERDPYWPKWNSPWWHMLLFHEMGIVKEIPKAAVIKMVEVLKHHYLPVFPIKEEEFPQGTDPYRKIACLCAIGSIYQVLFDYGIDVDSELPWMREWFLRYQLPDGGLNCDEAVYVKATPKSSIVTTLSCLESVLFSRNRELTQDEYKFLESGANYLLRQQLFRKVSTGEVIDKNWLEVRFPRFYEYDFLRGYYFLAKWREVSGLTIPDDLVDEVEKLVSHQLTDTGINLKRYNLFDSRSYNPGPDGTWTWGIASEFDLMKAASSDGCICLPLTKKWNEVKPKTALVTDSYETIYKNPIQLKIGENVKIEKRETSPEWLGWVYCVDSRGIAGWVSEKYLKESDQTAVVIKDYDATELTAAAGEHLKIYYEEFGWCWCKNKDGVKGWIPTKNLNVT